MARPTKVVVLSDGRNVTVRKLSWLQSRAAKKMSQQESAKGLIAMGGAEFSKAWKEIAAQREEETKDEPATEPDILLGYDLYTVLVSGVQDLTQEQIEDLDEDDAETLGRAILSMAAKAPTEDEEKNASSPSIVF